MKKTMSKKDAQAQIEVFFSHIKNKTPQEIKKMKRLAMSHNISLKNKRKTFCKKCLHPYVETSIRIKNGKISVVCESCGYVARWKFVENKEIMPIQHDEENECKC